MQRLTTVAPPTFFCGIIPLCNFQYRNGVCSITLILFEIISQNLVQYKQGVHGQGKSQGKNYFFKVRELSGNFETCQGILEFKQKSGKSQGILK